jgi:uncharacterized membrane protein
MGRINSLDNLRGIAFIFMIIHHICYYYDISNNGTTSYARNEIVDTCGTIARTLFIILAGYSINMTYNKYKEKYLEKRFFRSVEIFAHGLIITLVSYLLFPSEYIRFGILHFIGLGTLLISIFTPYKVAALGALAISLAVDVPKVSPIVDTITGAMPHYNMMDWFPLNRWIPYLLSGMIVGQHIDINKIKLLNSIPIINNDGILSIIGKNCLDLYTIHVVIFMILAYIKANKMYLFQE